MIATQLFIALFVTLNASCSSEDNETDNGKSQSGRTVLRQGKDFSVNAVDLGKYARIKLDKESANIEFTLSTTSITSVEVKPTNLNIQYEVNKNKLILLDVKPCKVAVTVNDDYKNPIYLFVDGVAPKEWNNLPANTIRYTKGSHTIDNSILQSDATIFLEEGAVLTGYFYASEKANIRILGYGIIDGRLQQKAIRMEKCRNIEINGPVIMSRNGWCTSFFECDGVKIDNVKILGSQMYSDGIDLVGTSNATVNDIFVRNEDDCIAIKTNKFGFSGNVENIMVKNSVFWGGELGNCLEIGWELDGTYLRNIRFENIDVIRKETCDNKFKRAIMSIHQCGNSTVSDVVYKNIRMESAYEHLVWMELIPNNQWGSGGGNIDNIRFENIEYIRGDDASVLIHNESTGNITNVIFSGFKYKGRTISDVSDPVFDIADAQVKVE